MDELKFFSYSEGMCDPRYVIFTLRRKDFVGNPCEEFVYIELCNWYMKQHLHTDCIYFQDHTSDKYICEDCDRFNELLSKITYKFTHIQTLKYDEFDRKGCVGLANYDKYCALLDDDGASYEDETEWDHRR